MHFRKSFLRKRAWRMSRTKSWLKTEKPSWKWNNSVWLASFYPASVIGTCSMVNKSRQTLFWTPGVWSCRFGALKKQFCGVNKYLLWKVSKRSVSCLWICTGSYVLVLTCWFPVGASECIWSVCNAEVTWWVRMGCSIGKLVRLFSVVNCLDLDVSSTSTALQDVQQHYLRTSISATMTRRRRCSMYNGNKDELCSESLRLPCCSGTCGFGSVSLAAASSHSVVELHWVSPRPVPKSDSTHSITKFLSDLKDHLIAVVRRCNKLHWIDG